MVFLKRRSIQGKNIGPSLIGNILEFYDLGLYGFYATILYENFFPESDPFTKNLAALGIFSAGFIMRPLGALIFGYVGDIYGRKKVLLITLFLTSLSSFLIGILPTYAEIGIYASFSLTFLRLLQGICTGGEYNTAAIFVLEHASEKHRGAFSGIITTTAILGFFLSSMMVHFTSLEVMPAWGWRIPFLFGGMAAFAGYKIRKLSFETRDFLKVAPQDQKGIPLLKAFQEDGRAIFATLSVGVLAGVLSLMMIGFLQSYLRDIFHEDVTYLCQGGMVLYGLSLLLFGFLSDYKGYERIMLGAALSAFLFALPIFLLLSSGHLLKVSIGITLLAFIAGAFLGPMHAYMFSIFPPEKRCSSISFCFSIGVALLGGTTPIISALLVQGTGLKFAPAFYLIFSAVVCLMGIGWHKNLGSNGLILRVGRPFMKTRASLR